MTQSSFQRLSDGLLHVPAAVGDNLDYSLEWAAWLASGESITQSSWSTSSGVQAGAQALSGSLATVWLSSAISGSFHVTNTVRTSAGRVIARTFVLDVYAEIS